jgi:hypothetical protein
MGSGYLNDLVNIGVAMERLDSEEIGSKSARQNVSENEADRL